MTEKDRLLQKKARYSRLKLVLDQPGWKDIEEILFGEYADALNVLKNPKYDKQEKEARGIIKFIDRFFEQIGSEFEIGKLAQEKFIKQYVNTPNGGL